MKEITLAKHQVDDVIFDVWTEEGSKSVHIYAGGESINMMSSVYITKDTASISSRNINVYVNTREEVEIDFWYRDDLNQYKKRSITIKKISPENGKISIVEE